MRYCQHRISVQFSIYFTGENRMHHVRTALMDSGRWVNFKCRPDDIFICAPVKCGTTWMQTIVAHLLWPAGNFPDLIVKMSPWIESRFIPAGILHSQLEAQTHRRFLKTHLPIFPLCL